MIAPGLSGRCWPAHVQPLPDESLSSWTLRLAAAHRIKVYAFAELTWPGRFVWHTRDLDRTATRDLTDRLAERTTCAPDRAWATTLGALAGVALPTPYPTHGRLRGVLDVRTFDGVRRRYGQQYCARCWVEDPVVYLRRAWRLSVVTVCPRHGVPLSDACPACDAPILMQRADVGSSADAPPPVLIPRCPACGADYCARASGHALQLTRSGPKRTRR